MARRRALALLGVGALVAPAIVPLACGGGQTPLNLFDPAWTNDQGRSIESVRLKLQGARPPLGADVAIGVAGETNRLVGMHLGEHGAHAKWTLDHPLDVRPIVTGSVVVLSGAGELLAVEVTTGKRLWSRQTGGLAVRGAGDDGSVTVVSMAASGGEGSVLLAVLHDGSVVRQIETRSALGAPAVLGGFAFVPWGNQYVSALDLSNGAEAGRVVLREQTSRAFTSGEGLYFGEIGVFRFDEHIKNSARGGASHVDVPTKSLPGDPKLMTPGTHAQKPLATAADRIHLYARPSAPEGPLALDSDRVYATYFRLVLGFEASSVASNTEPVEPDAGAKTVGAAPHARAQAALPDPLAWVHTHDADVLAGAAGAGYLALCDEKGRVTILDARTGGLMDVAELGEPLKGCVVQVEGYHPDREPAPVGTLASQITRAVANREAELATAQVLLLHELAKLADDSATKTLIDLASDPRTSPALLPDARKALAKRRTGAPEMLAALTKHYDFLEDVLRAPPVGPLAEALAAMKETRAAPLLAAHLLDPADTGEDVRAAAEALVILGGKAQLPSLEQFFALYRGTAPDEQVARAVGDVARALVKHGGEAGAARVNAALEDPLTDEQVRSTLADLDRSQPPRAPASARPARK